jgi:hypothetical protein
VIIFVLDLELGAFALRRSDGLRSARPKDCGEDAGDGDNGDDANADQPGRA